VLNPALIAAPTDHEGIVIGRDTLSRTPVSHDAFTAYNKPNRKLSSPNVVLLGVIGVGKTSLLKTVYVLRPLTLRRRRVVVMDKKPQGGQGEYAETCRRYGSEPITLAVGGGGSRLSMLDLALLDAGDGLGTVSRIVAAFTALAQDRDTVTVRGRRAINIALRETFRVADLDGYEAHLDHLLDNLARVVDLDPRPPHRAAARDALYGEAMEVLYALERLRADELAGIFDEPTTPDVNLDSRLTVFDISALPDSGPATSMAVTLANAWVRGRIARERGWLTNFVAEEGWHLADGPGGRAFRANSKLSRGLGLSNVAAFHHVADLSPDSPGIAMLREAGTVHIFRQDRHDDILAAQQYFRLHPSSAHTLENLPDGHHLLKIGNEPEIEVEHVRSPLEVRLTDSDKMMRAGR
jgi:hypothetical protein